MMVMSILYVGQRQKFLVRAKSVEAGQTSSSLLFLTADDLQSLRVVKFVVLRRVVE